jgi:RNA polymerase sigma factor (TIGR02999 family)
MATAPEDEVTGLLGRIRQGDAAAEHQLVAVLYHDLRALAARRMRRERPDHTWQPTALLHEALLRLRADGSLAVATDKTFLLRAASRAMHQLLIDHHRRHSAARHGGRQRKHPLDIALHHLAGAEELPLIALRDELDQLARVDERACMVVHLRFFLGMAPAEVAEALGVSLKTVERDWRFARGWLHDRLKPTEVP